MAESSNSQNNDETELTMCDVLEEEQELEDDANAVLGGSDDTNCSYDKGYVPRQALYACTTCSADQEPSGVCLACSYKCHDGHEIVELYTKRNFRCDCGNSKFPGKTCSLKPDKEPVNLLNKYNQNFKGLYCSCARPYPDLEDNTPDEMIQCVVCEDWYHGRHIGTVVPEDYFEMICSKCMESHKFLYSYLNKYHYVSINDDDNEKCNGASKSSSSIDEEKTTVPQVKTDSSVKNESDEKCNGTSKSSNSTDEEKASVQIKSEEIKTETSDVESAPGQPEQPLLKQDSDVESAPGQPEQPLLKEGSDVESTPGQPEQPLLKEDSDVKNTDIIKKEINVKPEQETAAVKEENKDCLLVKLIIKPDGIVNGPAFWPDDWRKELCRCSSCMDLYRKHECEFILNIDDTILAYEERGKSTTLSQYDKGLNALSQLDRVKQMEAIRAYTSMKGQLKEYLTEFANNKRTVCESDIKEFFERIGKRQRLSNGVPHFCR